MKVGQGKARQEARQEAKQEARQSKRQEARQEARGKRQGGIGKRQEARHREKTTEGDGLVRGMVIVVTSEVGSNEHFPQRSLAAECGHPHLPVDPLGLRSFLCLHLCEPYPQNFH